MSPEQCRAARSWLAWTQAELAAKAKVGLSTVKDYEAGKRRPMTNNLAAIRAALEDAGMRFTAGGVSGPIRKAVESGTSGLD
jgi:transcriptional regulator with XRE-family HTH domain